MENIQEPFLVYILKLIFGLVLGLGRGEASFPQKIGRKPDFSPIPARDYHKSHLVLLQIIFVLFFLHENLGI